MADRLIWFKGAVLPADEARISVLSPTAQYGLNVFEGIRCYGDEKGGGQLFIFRVEEHLTRLLDSCKLIGICPPYSKNQLQEFLIDTVRANQLHGDTAIRMTL